MQQEIWDLCKKYHSEIVKIRRDLHMHPETEFDLPRTAGVVATELKKLPLQIRENIAQSGIIADLKVVGATKTIALRADMDALPMQEMNDVTYKSKVDGKAHMCGHDVHTSMLIGAAQILCEMKNKLQVNVRFLFQPCEEKYPGGASSMIAEGAIEDVDEIYGLHVWPVIEKGTIAICPGAFMGQADDFTIKIEGKGSHAAAPQHSIDPVVIACQYVTMLQSIVSRSLDPFSSAVISVTQIDAGTATNIIPGSVILKGTVRTIDKIVQKKIQEKMDKMLQGITNSYDAKYTFDYRKGYPVTYNDKLCVEKSLYVAKKIVGNENVHYPYSPFLGGEDFSYYAQKIPGCFIALGSANVKKNIGTNVWHHPQFDVDEECILYGMALHSQLALNTSSMESKSSG